MYFNPYNFLLLATWNNLSWFLGLKRGNNKTKNLLGLLTKEIPASGFDKSTACILVGERRLSSRGFCFLTELECLAPSSGHEPAGQLFVWDLQFTPVVKQDMERKEESLLEIWKECLFRLWRTETIILPACSGGEHTKKELCLCQQ